MKKLFRDRKLSIESKARPAVSAPAPLGSTPPDTPLYARFASSHRPQDGPTKPTVSGPMHLLSRASFSRGHNGASSRGSDGHNGAPSRGSEGHNGASSRGSEGQERALNRMPSKQEQLQPQAKVLPTPPARTTSRAKWSAATPELPTPMAASTTSFPRTDSYESRNTSQDKFSFPAAPTASSSRVQLPPPEPLSRPDSIGSDSYVAPPRALVVRNGDPETSSSTSVSEIAASRPATTPRPPARTPTSAQYDRFLQNGFDLHDPGTQQAPSGPRQSPSASSPHETPLSSPLSSDRRDRQPATGRQAASRQESRSQYPSPPPKSPTIGTSASGSSSNLTPAPAAPSLLATPSIARRKYSPLAAFGLPVAQASTSVSPPPPSTHTEPARTDDVDPPVQVVQQPGVPGIPLLVESLGRSSPERPSISASSPSLPPLPDNSQAPEQTNTPPPSPRPPVQRQSIYDATEGEPRSPPTNLPNLTQRAPEVPAEDPPPYQPEPYSSRPGLQPLQPLQPPQASQGQAPDMVRHSLDPIERPPASPTKSRGARLHKHHREQEEVSRSYESNRSTPQPTPPPQATGPVRGKPLIFAAMTSAPDITGVEPAMVGMIGKASVETKIEQGYNAYAQGAHHHHQQQQPTPPPDPTPSQAPETSSKRKKLSKLHKPTSSRNAEPAPVEVPHSHVAGPSLSSLRTLEQNGASASHSHQRGTSVPVATANDALERHPTDADRQNRRKSVTSPDGKLHRRPKDGVKPLTDKQMEKLNHRLSYNGVVPGHREQLSPPFRKSFIEEHPASHPIQTAQYRISQGMPSPTSPQGTRHMSPPPPQGSHHTQYMAPPPPVQGSHHTQYMSPSQLPPAQWANPPQKRHMPPQLPTPPEEYNPGMPKARREPSPQKAPPLPPMDVEELEVAVPLPPRKGHRASVLPPQPADADPTEPMSFPLVSFLSNPVLLENLLAHLSFFEWVTLAQVTKDVRRVLYEEGREQVLERYLSTVGYSRWGWKDPEPLILTADDLCHYMRGVSIPSHRWAAIATNYLQPNSITSPHTMKELTYACRAFTRVVLRLRAQAEAEAAHNARMLAMSPYPDSGARPRTNSITSQRLPSKWASQSSLNHGSRAPSRAPSPVSSRAPSMQQRAQHAERVVNGFHSPLFRLRRAPLLQVFVPSPDGDWLSDASVLECEAELKRAGVLHLLRAGDVVWDTAVGDEANTGRMVWDGSYLIDLDYTYSRVGDPPRYLPTLAFPPSYFHRVIRTMGTGNPVVRIDLSPWVAQIHENLQLLQDKMRMETPQGGKHTVVRWVHRSSFVIRPPPGSKSIRLPMPQTAGPGPSPTGAWIIDPGWFGTVVVETEGTNEGLDDLNRRCKGPIQLRRGQQLRPEDAAAEEQRTVFRILREKSRPSEIWIRVVTAKERLIPLQ